MIENIISTEFIKAKENIGIWFYASELLKQNNLRNTGRNQYQLMIWLEKQNEGKIKDHFIQKNMSILVPKTEGDIKKICQLKIVLNQEKKEEVADSFSIKYPKLFLYETDRKPGKNSDGSDADDMKINDYSEVELKNHNSMFSFEISTFNLEPDNGVSCFIDTFKDMVISFFTKNLALRRVVLEQIDNFVSESPKAEFEDSVLNLYAQNHDNTKKLVDKVKVALIEMLKSAKGDIVQVCEINTKKEGNLLKKTLHWTTDKNKDWTPAFNTNKDRRNGLTIAVNDVWGYTIYVKDYILKSDGTFSGTLVFSMFDHFGLNEEDLHKGKIFTDFTLQTAKRMLAGFRAWFFLQHYKGFEGKYKPFITRMNFEEIFTGELNA